MRSSAEVLEGNKVKLTVEVDEEELQAAQSETMKRLQREVRVPGFRPGKAPARLLEARLGRKAIRDEVIRNSLGDYYAEAVVEAALDTIAAPEIDITSGEDEGPLSFDAVVEVRPKVSVGGYEGLQVTVPSPEVTDEMVDARIDMLREQFAQLEEVGRPAKEGDVVTIDVSATRSGEEAADLSTTDFAYEIGSAGLVPGLDEKLVGSKAGEIRDLEAEDAPGGPASLKVLVKLVRAKRLPEADDSFAEEASEFETMAELRADVFEQIGAIRRMQAQFALREGAVTELTKLVHDEIPETLVNEETQLLANRFAARLAERRISVNTYLEATGQEESQLVEDLRTQAEGQVRSDLALRALAEAESIEVTDDELTSEITRYAAETGREPAVVAREFAEGPGLERLRSELRNSKAAAWLVENVAVLDEQGNPMDKAVLLAERGSSSDREDDKGAEEMAEDATVVQSGTGETEEGQS